MIDRRTDRQTDSSITQTVIVSRALRLDKLQVITETQVFAGKQSLALVLITDRQ